MPKRFEVSIPISATVVASLAIQDVEKSLELRKKLNENSNNELLDRSLRWFKKAALTQDPIDDFVMEFAA